MKYLYSVLLGIFFSIILVKGEIVSWYRIQEMFLFESFHMYGIIGSAVVVGALSIIIIKKFNIKSISGEAIKIPAKPLRLFANFIGGSLFGMGWPMTGACPGPLYALLGYGNTVVIIPILCAILRVYVYGILSPKLPH